MPERQDQHSPLLELTKTRLREFFREKGMVFWVFGFPILMAVGLGLAFRSKPPDLPAVVLVAAEDDHRSEALLASPELNATRMDQREARRALAHAEYQLLVQLLPDKPPQYRFDPMVQNSAWAREVVERTLQIAAGRKDVFVSEQTTEAAPGSRYIDFLIPGLIAMNIMGSSMWGVGYNLVVARKRKLLRRYAMTAMRRSDFLLSYFISRSCFLLLELGILIPFGWLAFGTAIQGSLLAVVLTAVLGAASFAGISLLVGARVDNTEVAQGWMNFVQLPMWVLSGIFFTNARFPDWLQWPIAALPLSALAGALRAVYNEGAGLMLILPELGILAAWALAGFILSARVFRWQ